MDRIAPPLKVKARPVALAALLLALIALAASFQAVADGLAGPTPIEAGAGPWRNATEVDCNEIEPGTVCAEWPSLRNGTIKVCCVDPSAVGTFQNEGTACHYVVGERAYY